MLNVIVIGGGASGLMSAIWAARFHAGVTLLEHNEKIGKKILATGNGRCNFTNQLQSPFCYRGTDGSFAWEVIRKFSAEDTLAFFQSLGIYPKERNGWYYPYSDQAQAILEVLEAEARHLKIKIKTCQQVIGVLPQKEGYLVETDSWQYSADRVIVACGSPASNVEGSSGDGYTIARNLGLSVVEPYPALVPLRLVGNWFSKWTGVRMQGTIQLIRDGNPEEKERGELLFTDYGISGIAVFQISGKAVRSLKQGQRVAIRLDLMPELSESELKSMIEDRMQQCPYKSFGESLVGLLPAKLISVLSKKAEDAGKLACLLKNWEIPVKDGASLRQAQICSGGIAVKELTQEMESRRYPGLYFAGEVVDVDGPCGGYNLQWAWSSGATAGKAAAREIE